MPRISSTSCITGTGFMKWKPMNLSGRSVRLASRVIEIDEVFEVRMVSGPRCGTIASKILFLMSSRSVAASITRSVPAMSSTFEVVRMRAMVAALSSAETLPRLTCRSRLRSMVAIAMSSASALTSFKSTSYPASANTCAIPLPICPAPTIPTDWIAMSRDPSPLSCRTIGGKRGGPQ